MVIIHDMQRTHNGVGNTFWLRSVLNSLEYCFGVYAVKIPCLLYVLRVLYHLSYTYTSVLSTIYFACLIYIFMIIGFLIAIIYIFYCYLGKV